MSEKELPHQYIAESAHVEDAQTLATMQSQSWLDTYQVEGEDERNAEVQAYVDAMRTPERVNMRGMYIERAVDNPLAFYKVVRDEQGVAIGLAFGSKRSEPQELVAFYVDKNHHGTGAAQSLMEAFIDWSDPDKPINVGVLHDNERAQRFYEKFGFQPVPETLRPFQESKHLFEITMQRPANINNTTKEINE